MADPFPDAPRPGAVDLFLAFGRIGLTSFGGGLSGWLLRDIVQRRRWLGEEEFLNGLALSQALPGVSVANVAVWFGYRLRGLPGAAAALLGIVGPPAVAIVLLAVLFAALAAYPAARLGLDGASAAAVGLSLSTAATVARRVPRRVVPVLTMAGTFVAVALLHWPLLRVVLGAGAFSVAAEYRRLGRSPAP